MSSLNTMPKVLAYVVVVAVTTLAVNQVAMTMALLIGLYFKEVNNDDVFKIIGPAFNNIVGAFIGLVAGIALGRSQTTENTDAPPVRKE